MSDQILNKYIEQGFKTIREIDNINMREGARYIVLSKENNKYLLKIKNLSDKNKSQCFDKNILQKYSIFGYPKVSEVITIGNKMVSLTSFYEGIVLSDKAYTNLDPAYYTKILSFLNRYLDFLIHNMDSSCYLSQKRDTTYFITHLNKYDRLIKNRFNEKFSSIITSAKIGLYKNKKTFNDMIVVQHGDCYGCNMVLGSDHKIMLIDWESIKNVPVFYDIAVFISKHAVDKDLIINIYRTVKNGCSEKINVDLLNLTILLILIKQLSDISALSDDLFKSKLFSNYLQSLFETIEYFFCEYENNKTI